MNSAGRRLLLLLAALVAVGLVAYLITASIAPEESVRVTLTIPAGSFTFMGFYAGVEAGIFQQEGIDLEIVVTRPAATAVQAVIAGSAEFIAVSESAATAMLQGADLKILAYWAEDIQYYLLSRPGIDSVEELRGGIVGVSRLRSQSAVVMEEILLSFDLVPGEDVELLAVGGGADRVAALRQGSIDATLDNPPDSVIAENLGFTALIKSGDVLQRKLISFLATSQQMIDEQPATVKKMVKATVRSVKYVLANEQETTAIAMEMLGIEEDLARATFGLYKEVWGYRPDPADLQFLFDVQNGFLDEPVQYDVTDYVDYSFVNEVLEELGEQPLS